MSNLIQVKPEVNRLIKFMSEIEEGKFKIPTFQRDFIWDKNDKIDLFDSISKEYPIGSIMLWQPKYEFDNNGKIGPYEIDNTNSKDYFYILDGFQRLSTLFGCLTNPYKTKLKYDQIKLKKEFTLFYDLEEESFTMNSNGRLTSIPVYLLIDTYAFLDYLDSLRSEINDNEKSKYLVDKAKKLSSTLIDYQIPSIEIFGGSIKDAIDIFSRVNSKGITISQDWMLSALTSNEDEGFNLGEILGNLLLDLKEYNFGDMKRDILVQCIQNSFGKMYFDQRIEDLANRKDFKEVTYRTVESIKKAVKFLYEELLVIDRKLLPYNNQLIFISYFFSEIDEPNEEHKRKLKDWFWVSTYSNYFTIYSLSKIRLAFEQFKRFIRNQNENPIFHDGANQKFSIADLPNTVSTKSVRSTALVLFLLNYSEKFKKVNSPDIESLKISFLQKGNTTHASVMPIIEYTNSANDGLPFEYNKPQDMTYLFEQSNFNSFAQRYFLNDKMIELYHDRKFDEILNERMVLITKAERKFVEYFDIFYGEND
jgi:hypothetical protein